MDLVNNLVLGFGIALHWQNILYCFVGVLLGTLIGVLPGIGPIATISMLLPATFVLPPVSALIMLAGIYYGAQYGGSTTAILVFIASMGSRDFRWRQSLILGVILVIFCALVFVWGLKLPIPLCPDIESLQSSVGFCRG